MRVAACWAARPLPLLLAAAVLVLLPRLASAQSGAKTPRPNVLFIAVDDLNTHLSVYGNKIVKTPNIERLARRGIVFGRAYCQLPWCNPSRASLLSGRRPDTTRVVDLDTPPRTHLPGVTLLPEHFKRNGYFSARVGKIYHESGAKKMQEAANDPLSWDLSEEGHGKGLRKVARGGLITGRGTRSGQDGFPGFRWAALDVEDEDTSDGVVARRIAALMERAKGDKPFFLAAGFRKPHLMWEAPKKYFDLYKLEQIPLPREPSDHLANVPGPARGPAGSKQPPLSDTDVRQARLAYYACVSFVDAQIGVLLDTMDRLKLWDNTVVVLWGDHGYNLGEHGGQWEKVKLWEESIRAPLVLAAPETRTNAKSPRVVEFLDIYPTLVELCGLPDPGGLQGKSLVPLLARPDAPWDRAAFSVLGNPQTDTIRHRSVRTERWHYVEYGEDGKDGRMLYDHASDPHEYKNLADDPAHAPTVAEMRQRMRRERERIGGVEKAAEKTAAETAK